MIKSIKIKNYVGEQIEIVLTDSKPTHGLLIKKIDGLGPSSSTISKEAYGFIQGSYIKNARVEVKNVVITFLLDDSHISIEEARKNVYKYCPVMTEVTVIVENDSGTFEITGMVESCEPDIFSKEESVVASILCPNPFWNKTANPGSADNYAQDLSGSGSMITFTADTDEIIPCTFDVIFTNRYSVYDNTRLVFIKYAASSSEISSRTCQMYIDFTAMKALLPDFAETGILMGDRFSAYRYNDETVVQYHRIVSYDRNDPWNNSTWREPLDITSVIGFSEGQDGDLVIYPSGYENRMLYVANGPYYESIGRISYTINGGAIGKAAFEHGDLSLSYGGSIINGALFEISIVSDIASFDDLIIRDTRNHQMTINLEYALEMVAGVPEQGQSNSLLAGDVIQLSSVDGNKYVSFTRNNTTINIIDACGSIEYDWPRLYPGENSLVCTGIDTSKSKAMLYYDELHGGI